MEREWTISDMARDFNVTLRALRFYEARGMLRPRREGQNRLYGAEERMRLQLILAAKAMGFTLSEIVRMTDVVPTNGANGELSLTKEQILQQVSYLETQHKAIETALGELRRRYYMMDEFAGASDEVHAAAM
jgi:DNA-binding transcriptional MerR regulator